MRPNRSQRVEEFRISQELGVLDEDRHVPRSSTQRDRLDHTTLLPVAQARHVTVVDLQGMAGEGGEAYSTREARDELLQ